MCFGPIIIKQIQSFVGRMVTLCMLIQPKCDNMGCGSYSLGNSGGDWQKLAKYCNFSITLVVGLILSSFSFIMQMKS